MPGPAKNTDRPAAPVVSQADGELREQIAAWIDGDHPHDEWTWPAVDDLLALPAVQRLIAAEAAVQRVRAAIDRHADNLTPTQRAAFARALDGDT